MTVMDVIAGALLAFSAVLAVGALLCILPIAAERHERLARSHKPEEPAPVKARTAPSVARPRAAGSSYYDCCPHDVDEWSEHVNSPCGDCVEASCDYQEPHAHGFACGPDCRCDMSAQRSSTVLLNRAQEES